MRFITASLAIVAAALLVTACSSKKPSDASAEATANPAPQSTSVMASVPGVEAIPVYPGAVVDTKKSGAMDSVRQIKVMTTPDSFKKVYGWYVKQLPTALPNGPVSNTGQSGSLVIGRQGHTQTFVRVTTIGATTTINLFHVNVPGD
jgi:hypothetical protein